MKKILFVLFALPCCYGFSQTAREIFSKRTAAAVHREQLLGASTVKQIIPDCPAHWDQTIDIVYVYISGYKNGNELRASADGETLSDKQKEILKNSDLGTIVEVEIWFRWKDSTTALGDYGKIQKMNEYRLAVVPEIEAEYPGGKEEVSKYLEENILPKVQTLGEEKQITLVQGFFTIDENGKLSDLNFPGQAHASDCDRVLKDALKNMPDWTPAKNANGSHIKQVFNFSFYVPQKRNSPMGLNRSGC